MSCSSRVSVSASGPRKHSMDQGAVGGSTDAAQMVQDYEVVRHRYEEVLKENENLKVEQQRRMESYMRRESNLQSDIDDLKQEVERQAASKPAPQTAHTPASHPTPPRPRSVPSAHHPTLAHYAPPHFTPPHHAQPYRTPPPPNPSPPPYF